MKSCADLARSELESGVRLIGSFATNPPLDNPVFAFLAAGALFAILLTGTAPVKFVVLFLAWIWYGTAWIGKRRDLATHDRSVDAFLDSMQDRLASGGVTLNEPTLVGVYKPLRDLWHLRRDPDLAAWVYRNREIAVYARSEFDRVVAYLNHFLRAYRGILSDADVDVDRTRHRRTLQLLRDLQGVVLNSLRALVFVVPADTHGTLAGIVDEVRDVLQDRITVAEGTTRSANIVPDDPAADARYTGYFTSTTPA